MAKAKEYEFRVHELTEFEGYEVMAYYTKGHHDKEKFANFIKDNYKQDINLEFVHHAYGMFVPYAGEKITLLTEFKEPTKRCFPMTYVDV